MKRRGSGLAAILVLPLLPMAAGAGPPVSLESDSLQIEYSARSFDERRAFGNLGLDSRTARQKLLDLDGRLELTGPLSFDFETDVVERRRLIGDDAIALANGWTRSRRAESTMRVGAYGDRVRLTSRYGWSREDPLAMPVGLESDAWSGTRALSDLDRLTEAAADQGVAFAHRLDAKLWQSPLFRVSTFGLYSRVGADYASLRPSDEKDLFSHRDRRVLRLGGRMGLGPVEIKLSHDLDDRGLEESDDPTHIERNRAAVLFSLDELRDLTGREWREGAWHLAPDTVWVEVARARSGPMDDPNHPKDSIRDEAVGASWYGDRWSADVSVWRSFYDSRAPGAEAADWSGHGMDVGAGLRGDYWEVYASAGLTRSRDLEPTDRSTDRSLDGSLLVALYSEELPDVSAVASFNQYDWTYFPYGGASLRTSRWDVTLDVDFSKYLARRFAGKPLLRLSYQALGHATQGLERDTGASHAALLSFGLQF